MQPDNFKSSLAGRVIHDPKGFYAFVPAKLPPSISFEQDLVAALSRADAALGELSGYGQILPNPHVLIGSSVRREAVMSSRIEGTQATLSEILLDEATPAASPRPKNADDLGEVHNYVLALDYGIERLKSFPLSLRLVREIHEKLMAGVRGYHATPGEFRRSQNWIGPAGSNPANADYVPPPIGEMTELLSDWEEYLHNRDSMPDLIQCAILHEQFEAIHPFLDGNGRIGRLLITLFLIERGRLSQPLLYLSDFIERHRSDYYELHQNIRTRGEWIPWIRFFLAGIEATAKDAALRARRLAGIREVLMRETGGAHALVDSLLSNPYITLATAAKVLGVSIPTATRRIRELESKGVLREATGRGWRKVYLAAEILTVMEKRTDSPA
jgi:Fic family protein